MEKIDCYNAIDFIAACWNGRMNVVYEDNNHTIIVVESSNATVNNKRLYPGINPRAIGETDDTFYEISLQCKEISFSNYNGNVRTEFIIQK